MSSKWHEKKARLAQIQFEKELQNQDEAFNEEKVERDLKDVAMGGGDVELFEKKMTKEEKKAAKKAAREAKKKAKGKGDDDDDDDDDDGKNKSVGEVMDKAKDMLADTEGVALGRTEDDGLDHDQADILAAAGTICTFSASKKGVDARSRDINVQNFTLQHMGAVMLDETEIVLNHGNRYGLIGRNVRI